MIMRIVMPEKIQKRVSMLYLLFNIEFYSTNVNYELFFLYAQTTNMYDNDKSLMSIRKEQSLLKNSTLIRSQRSQKVN